MSKLVTRGRFLRYQNEFYKKASRSDIIALFTKIIPTINSGSLDDFLGTSSRSSESKEIPILFNKDALDHSRESFGISKQFTGTIYVAPKHLIDSFGTFKIEENKFIVTLQEHDYVINNFNYLELMYESCLSVELELISAIKE
jgi:hypothetical protein